MRQQHKLKSNIEESLAQMFMQEPNNLSWLAFLLTGDRTQSADAEVEALRRKDVAKPFFENWIAAWSRKIFIARVLLAVHPAISASALRIEERYSEFCREIQSLQTLDWSFDTDSDKSELERGLLAIDTFPRCALLLMVFEKHSLDDVAILLNVDKQLVVVAKTLALIELSRSMERTRLRSRPCFRPWHPTQSINRPL